jgi:hypothetical protein
MLLLTAFPDKKEGIFEFGALGFGDVVNAIELARAVGKLAGAERIIGRRGDPANGQTQILEFCFRFWFCFVLWLSSCFRCRFGFGVPFLPVRSFSRAHGVSLHYWLQTCPGLGPPMILSVAVLLK